MLCICDYSEPKCAVLEETFLKKSMPTVRVETNLSADFFPNDFMPLFLIFLAELLGKDKNIMKFVFDTDKNMTIVSIYLPT